MTPTTQSILVVDDDQDCLEFARTVLEPHYDVRTATSIESCRDELATRKPDLLLLDVMMTHLSDGLDFTRELKSTDATCDIPIIMLTCVNSVYDYRDEVDEKFFPYDRWLNKPVQPAILLQAVRDLLNDGDSDAARKSSGTSA